MNVLLLQVEATKQTGSRCTVQGFLNITISDRNPSVPQFSPRPDWEVTVADNFPVYTQVSPSLHGITVCYRSWVIVGDESVISRYHCLLS